MRTSMIVLQAIFLVMTAPFARAVSVTTEEVAEAARWTAAKFEGKIELRPPLGYLMAYMKSGRVQKNEVTTIGYGIYEAETRPLRIAAKEYRRGLHCSSEGRVVVHLPGPGKIFEAILGVDSNGLTTFPSNAGRGRVIASVEVGGKEALRSNVMREGLPGVPVKVDLGGAREFALGLSDAGGGTVQRVNFNQADWAEARVTLADGKTLWLDELPIGPSRAAYSTKPPFSFQYGGKASSALLNTWELKRSQRNLDDKRTEHTLTYTDSRTGLVLRCVAVQYQDFPTVEWTLYLKNTSGRPTPILENLQALDTRLERNGEGEFLLHYGKGSPYSGLAPPQPTEYAPLETWLDAGMEKRFAARDGMPAGGDLPYFNVEWPGEGVIIAVGWPGQWAGRFLRDDGNGLRVEAGQELTHFKLLPGEEVRTPLISMVFWKGEWIRAQNIWRRWMIAHNLPRPGGELHPPQYAAGSAAQYIEMAEANEENQFMFINRYWEEGLKFDYWWVDAGWYPFQEGWWEMGTWEPDPKRFPRGLRPISDHLHAQGSKLIVWFVPERAIRGTWLFENRPEWLVGRGSERRLFYLGNPEARKWMTDRVDKLITEQGIDTYRQDGGGWLPFWRDNDTEDRRGITENFHLQGLLAYWDELHRRHPNMLMDICSGGGSRNELETLRRAVPLWRSDYAYETTGMQNHTYGMALWIPYFGTGTNAFDQYTFRSQMAPALSSIWDFRRKDLDYGLLKQLVAQWRQVADNYYGDYYPLTSYRTENDVWMAWQFDRPEVGEGMVQAFRRPQSPMAAANFKLRGLDPAGGYAVTNLDLPGVTETTGKELMEHGLLVTLKNQPDSGLIVYKRVK